LIRIEDTMKEIRKVIGNTVKVVLEMRGGMTIGQKTKMIVDMKREIPKIELSKLHGERMIGDRNDRSVY